MGATVFGTRKGELTWMAKGRGCGVRWGGVVYGWDSGTPRCGMCECGRAPRLPQGELGGRGLAPGSPGPGAGREREGYLRSRRGCGIRAALIPARGGRSALARRPECGAEGRGRSEVASGAGRVCAGWGRRGRAACRLPTVTEERGWRQSASLGCLSPPAGKPVVVAGLWHPGQTRSIGGSSRGSPGC